MMVFVSKGDFYKIYWDSSISFLKCIWNIPLQISEVDFQKNFEEYLEQLIIYKPHYLLVDTQGSKNLLNQLDLQIVLESYRYDGDESLKKIAWVISKDVFSQISYELLLEEIAKNHYEFQFFGNEKDALDWLIR